MQIFVDADACPVVAIIEKIAKDNSVPVMLLCDTNHVLSSTYSKVVVVGAGADAVDYKLISICHKGDIVVSQDYGVAAMALGKGAYAIHQSGKWYTNNNIDQMLMERHLNKKARRSSHLNPADSIRHGKGNTYDHRKTCGHAANCCSPFSPQSFFVFFFRNTAFYFRDPFLITSHW